ncbi:MAG: hypothetical protein HFJ12_00685 [Bacilli bacterium]|nr:hypothetical protein [Bacilli bacterium]
MEIVTKHYMEVFLPIYLDGKIPLDLPTETSINLVSERDPLLFDDDTNRKVMLGFRFFDITEVTLDDGEVLCGKRKNYSPVFYYGKRLGLSDVNELGMLSKDFMKEKGITSVMKCDCGCFITNPEKGNPTIEEYKNQLLSNKNSVKQMKLRN